jgi:hypothetical protein
MADPLSISASIVAVLQLTSSVIRYANDVRTASEESAALQKELLSITGSLYSLKDIADVTPELYMPVFTTLGTPEGPLDQFKMLLDHMAVKLAPAAGLKKAGRAIVWPFRKEEFRDMLAATERHKTLFMLALQNDNMSPLLSRTLSESHTEYLQAPIHCNQRRC